MIEGFRLRVAKSRSLLSLDDGQNPSQRRHNSIQAQIKKKPQQAYASLNCPFWVPQNLFPTSSIGQLILSPTNVFFFTGNML